MTQRMDLTPGIYDCGMGEGRWYRKFYCDKWFDGAKTIHQAAATHIQSCSQAEYWNDFDRAPRVTHVADCVGRRVPPRIIRMSSQEVRELVQKKPQQEQLRLFDVFQ